MTDDTPISYEAAARGTPVLSSAGTQIGTLEHVLEVPELDVFDGIVIATKAGLRFIDADYVQQITRRHIRCSLDDAEANLAWDQGTGGTYSHPGRVYLVYTNRSAPTATE